MSFPKFSTIVVSGVTNTINALIDGLFPFQKQTVHADLLAPTKSFLNAFDGVTMMLMPPGLHLCGQH